MENKNKHVRVGFSTILWAVLAIVLCAAPCSWAVIYDDGQEHNIDDEILGDYVQVDNATVNLLPGAHIEWYLCANTGSTVNIKGGTVDMWIDVAESATVTVYGTNFNLGEGEHFIDYGTVTGFYENGDPINLTFDCQPGATVTLAAPGGEAQLWVFPGIINRYGPLSKIWAIVRLPEGITKDDIDSEPLVLYADGYKEVEIEASCQRIVQWCRNGAVRVTIFAIFDKASLTDAIPDDGQVGLKVVGQLNTGQFYGIDTVRIVSWYW